MKIILASQSPSRKKLLSKIGLKFEVFAPNIEEEKLLDPKKPSDSCYAIAKQKALTAKIKHQKDLIISCDQMAYLNGELFGKAHTEKKAIETLVQLEGKTHTLISALCMSWGKKECFHISKSYLSMRPLSFKQIKDYVKKEQPLKSAGSYHVESVGLTLFEKIKTEDFNSIEGLPLIKIVNQLIKWNYPIWNNIHQNFF